MAHYYRVSTVSQYDGAITTRFFSAKIEAAIYAYEHQDDHPFSYDDSDNTLIHKALRLMNILERQVTYCDDHRDDAESWQTMMHNIEKVAHRYDIDPCYLDDVIRGRLLRKWLVSHPTIAPSAL